jgi:hypothetical protein
MKTRIALAGLPLVLLLSACGGTEACCRSKKGLDPTDPVKHPEADGAEHVGDYGQGSVVERVGDKSEVEAGLDPW